MSVKYIFVTGGVVSGLGKGITAGSLGRLLKARGLKVTIQKLDPYLNIDPGNMNPYQHGEVFVTEDGVETDLDLGHYERFIDENLGPHSNITAGKIYWSVISKEREGVYSGNTVQVIPHITNEIKDQIRRGAGTDSDVAIIEIGGTVGDIESLPFLEAIRQFGVDVGNENVMYLHVTLVPRLSMSNELKTKPTQHSVKELLGIGIQPDVIVCRSDMPLGRDLRDKIGLFCNIPGERVVENIDLPILYEVPLALEKEGLAELVVKKFGLDCKDADLSEWINMVDKISKLENTITIALVGKYVALHDAYISIVEALKHGGFTVNSDVRVKWIDSETLTDENAHEMLSDVDGIVVPGGFGVRGTAGKIAAAKYARENKRPYLGVCLGMQMAIIDFARNVLKIKDANSSEFDIHTPHPVVDLLPEEKIGGNYEGIMRLGKCPCKLVVGTKAYEAYGKKFIEERHRHRYEINNDYKDLLIKNGMIVSGTSPDGRLVEMIELADHPWFVASQFHPEFKSRPNRPHPLFSAFIKATLENK